MDLLNMTNRAQIHEFFKKVTVKPLNFAALKFLRIQNFVALKICFFLVVLICYNDKQIFSRIALIARFYNDRDIREN